MSDLRADSSLLSLPTRRSFLKGAGAALLVPGREWARTRRPGRVLGEYEHRGEPSKRQRSRGGASDAGPA